MNKQFKHIKNVIFNSITEEKPLISGKFFERWICPLEQIIRQGVMESGLRLSDTENYLRPKTACFVEAFLNG